MAQNSYGKKKKKRFSVRPSTIFLYLAVLLLMFIIIFFTYNVINGEDGNSSTETLFTPVTPAPITVATTVTTTSAPETAPNQPESNDNSSGSDNSSSGSDNPTDFDESYFDDSLFIGDSITTGLTLYGFLGEDKVFAKQSLAPSDVMNVEIDGINLVDKISKFKPKKIFIMLGTNSVGYADTSYLVDSMADLINTIKNESTATIYVISIPPITREAEASGDVYLSKSAINEYNSALKEKASSLKVKFIDLNSVLSGDDGYYIEEYAEMDGIHFMGNTYRVMLSYIQKVTGR